MCETFARAGARVAFTYSTNDEDAEESKRRITEASPAGEAPLVFKGDVADSKHVDQTMAAVVGEWGGIDVLVNNAAITQVLPLALLEEADWDRVMDVNAKGPYLFSRAALKHMIRAKSGHILNIGNFSSERVIEAPIHFAASKSALRGLTEALAREVGRYDIKVNLLAPGLLDTGLGRMLPQHRVQEYLAQCPAGRLGRVEEVAELAAFLVSDENTFMTGAKVVADGGL
jgi:NAD(P)-dependent dehydrogenase (short-subunit alcohol dehydrogenase family)